MSLKLESTQLDGAIVQEMTKVPFFQTWLLTLQEDMQRMQDIVNAQQAEIEALKAKP